MRRLQLQGAKARLGEPVREAAADGRQTITVRGQRAAVLLSTEAYNCLKHPKPSLPELLQASPLAGLNPDIERDRSPPRGIDP